MMEWIPRCPIYNTYDLSMNPNAVDLLVENLHVVNQHIFDNPNPDAVRTLFYCSHHRLQMM
jgi:hypothetical protein